MNTTTDEPGPEPEDFDAVQMAARLESARFDRDILFKYAALPGTVDEMVYQTLIRKANDLKDHLRETEY